MILYGALIEAAQFMKSPQEILDRYRGLYDRALQTFLAFEQGRVRSDENVKGEIGTRG